MHEQRVGYDQLEAKVRQPPRTRVPALPEPAQRYRADGARSDARKQHRDHALSSRLTGKGQRSAGQRAPTCRASTTAPPTGTQRMPTPTSVTPGGAPAEEDAATGSTSL
jgi:hypothetical protein